MWMAVSHITFFMGLGLFQNLVPYFQWVIE